MARIRTIKPELAKDEDLAKLSIPTRYLFAFITTLADREGRLEDRPRVIKLEIFPWDDVDVDEMLASLSPKFLVRYESEGRRFIQIRTFLKHQRPHFKESVSIIKPPTASDLKNKASVVESPIKVGASTNLNPASPLEVGREGKENRWEGEQMGRSLAVSAKEAKPLTPIQKVIRAYKQAIGVDAEDKDWDRKFFSRHTRPATDLLKAFDGDADKAMIYLIAKGMEWNESGLAGWGLEGIIKSAARDFARISTGGENDRRTDGDGQGLRNELDKGAVGAARLLEPRGSSRPTRIGTIAGEVVENLKSIRDDSEPGGAWTEDGADGF